MNEQGELVGIKVIKGKADPASNYEVDGISGATITRKGLESFLVEDLKKYESFFKKIQTRIILMDFLDKKSKVALTDPLDEKQSH